MKKYIYINSYPRSGSTFIETCLNAMYGDHNGHDILLDTPAKVLHSPELLLENLEGIAQVTIIRDPAECISSFMIKDIGFMLKVPNVNEVEKFNRYIESKIEYYVKYIDAIKSNIKNLMVLDFEDIKKDSQFQLIKISEFAGLKYNGDISEIVSGSMRYLKSNSEYNQFHNSIPIKKSKSYQEYIDYINYNYEKEISIIKKDIQKILS
jgi:hypothetical protein